jgi:hypothetical protein
MLIARYNSVQKPLIIPGATRFGLANVATRYVGYPTWHVEALRCNLQPGKTKDETIVLRFCGIAKNI